MDKWMEWFEQPYAEDNELLNTFVDDYLRRTSLGLFDNQNQVVNMANETAEGIPSFKEGAIEIIRQHCRNELGWLIHYMVTRILISYLKNNILPNEEVKWWFEDELPEEDIESFWEEIDKYIWDDYSKYIDKGRMEELWEKWGKSKYDWME